MKQLIKFVIFISVITVSSWYSYKWMDKKDSFAIKKIILMTNLTQQNQEDLLALTREAIEGNFFTLNLQKIRQSIEALAWIEEVSVRKVWSDAIQIKIIEKTAVAKWQKLELVSSKELKGIRKNININWDNQSLLSHKGLVFKPRLDQQQQDYFDAYSLYSGPDNLSKVVMNRCDEMSAILAKAKQKIIHCFLDQRRSWSVKLAPMNKRDSGKYSINLILGSSEVNELKSEKVIHKAIQKMNVFVKLYRENLYKHANNISQVDMRYTNGFAITWKS